MKIEKYKVASVSYILKSGGEVVETVDAQNPMTFIFGVGYLLPKFEDNIEHKSPGDKFDFELPCEDAYGAIVPDAIVELNKDMFTEENGQVNEELFKVGTIIPLRDNEGNRFDGRVTEVKDNSLMIDLNHPMAGKDLHFTGEVIEVRNATEQELASLESGCGCGCGCGGDGCGDGDCGGHHHH
ncbi:MAG: FKBP-type peptidyl-prolyl cis-trans isomerase [Prevotellaceae bacterium]|jgi:FKBP-type peptidyl-prolyl cis-trans isomerase SlyD|nr:FKBP-type peptidyl-prolyl cis-trans isomerase [Prevotellaceae bacterium]